MKLLNGRRGLGLMLVVVLALAAATKLAGYVDRFALGDDGDIAAVSPDQDLDRQADTASEQPETIPIRPAVESRAPAAPVTQIEPKPGTQPVPAPMGDRATLVAHAVVEEVVAYRGPASKQIVARLTNPNRHGGPLVFQALTEPDSDLVASGWIQVLLPVRPNGTTGWIPTSSVELTKNPYRIEVDVDDFHLTVFRDGQPHFSTEVGIGEGDTPTPHGSFYLTDLLQPSDPNGSYGPFAYGLSGFSETLSSFNGGEGVIGIHGTNRPAAIGTRVSHGCIRVANDAITELSAFLPLGTPVVIGDDPSGATG